MLGTNHSKNIKMKTIYLDIGNSNLKAVEKTDIKWEVICQCSIRSIQEFFDILEKESSKFELILSSVRRDVVKMLMDRFPSMQLKEIHTGLIPGFNLDYNTPDTLGIDRYLACLGASVTTNENVIVVDAGTACTIDIMTSDKIFRGGVIMPGLQTIHLAMIDYLPELPHVEKSVPEHWPGKSTRECVELGTNGTFFHSIKSFLEESLNHLEHGVVFITGGDGNLVKQFLSGKVPVPVKFRPYLLFDGMVEFVKLDEF
jgi:type III pantothenate kinase